MSNTFISQNANGVKRIVPKNRVNEVKNKVSIPEYFDKVILPQMGSYYDLYPVDFENKPVVCCPLHDEDTPSFRYYPDTSSFYCFGCQKGGNVITLHRYFTESITGTNPEYDEAVDYLFSLFVEGKEREATSILPSIMTQEKKSTDAELLSFNIYRVDLEDSINSDNTLGEQIKREIFKALDKIDVLIDKDIVNASEAKSWMKSFVRNKLVTA